MYVHNFKNRICQGDIYKNIEMKLDFEISNKKLSGKIKYQFGVVMTQDCDLEQDFNNRQLSTKNQRNRIISILLCPAFIPDDLRYGNHLKTSKIECGHLNSGLWAPIKKNKDKRYHFLEGEDIYLEYPPYFINVPDLIIDFKYYQTIPRDLFYNHFKNNYRISIDKLYREEISDRFTHYLGRIGLPNKDEESSRYICES